MPDYSSRTLPPLPPKPPETPMSQYTKIGAARMVAMDQLRQAELAEATLRNARRRAKSATQSFLDMVEALHGTLLDELEPREVVIPKPGDRVRMTGLQPEEPDPLPIGLEGTVQHVNAAVFQIYVTWDLAPGERRRRSLILLTTDPFEIIS